MSIAVRHNSEIAGVALAAVTIVAFVVIALTGVPELIAPSGGKDVGASALERTVRMI